MRPVFVNISREENNPFFVNLDHIVGIWTDQYQRTTLSFSFKAPIDTPTIASRDEIMRRIQAALEANK